MAGKIFERESAGRLAGKYPFYFSGAAKKWALTIIFVLALGGSVGAQIKQVETLYRMGIASRGKAGSTTDVAKNIGYLETAIKHFTEALAIEPRNIKILLERATTHKMMFEYEKALADCETALGFVSEKKIPDKIERARVFRTKGEIYEHQNEYLKAIEQYRLALESNPNDPAVKSAISRNRLLAGEDVSEDEIDQAMNSSLGLFGSLPKPKNMNPELKRLLDPKPDNFYRLGLANLKKAANAGSEKSRKYFNHLAYRNLTKSIDRQPAFAAAYFQRSKTYELDDERRLDDLNRALELKPDFVDAYLARADYWIDIDAENRLSDLTEAVALKPSNREILLQRGRVYLELYEFEKALADAEKALDLIPRSARKYQPELADAHKFFGEIYEKGYHFEKAVQCYTEALKYDANNSLVYNRRADVYRFIGEEKKAVADDFKADFLRKTKKSSTETVLLIEESLWVSNVKQPVDYLELFQKVLFTDVSGYVEVIVYPSGAPEEIRKVQDREIAKRMRLIEFNPASDLARRNLAEFYLQVERFDEAIAEFTKLAAKEPRYEYLNNLGVALAEKGRLEEALAQFALAVGKKEADHRAFYNRGLIYAKRDENEKAVADFTEVVERRPDYMPVYKSRGKALRALGRIEEAAADEAKLKGQ